MSTKSIKKAIAFTTLALILATAPMAAATSGSIQLTGQVPAILELSVSASPSASTLPITTTVTDFEVATVLERSNKKAGYTVTLQSANMIAAGLSAPELRSAETPDVLPYTLKYDGSPVVFSGGVAVISNTSGKTAAIGVTKSLTVSFDGANNFLDESTYGDTLVLTIIAK